MCARLSYILLVLKNTWKRIRLDRQSLMRTPACAGRPCRQRLLTKQSGTNFGWHFFLWLQASVCVRSNISYLATWHLPAGVHSCVRQACNQGGPARPARLAPHHVAITRADSPWCFVDVQSAFLILVLVQGVHAPSPTPVTRARCGSEATAPWRWAHTAANSAASVVHVAGSPIWVAGRRTLRMAGLSRNSKAARNAAPSRQ